MTIKSIRTGWTGISALAGNDQWFSDFESIASVTVGAGGQSTIEFSSVPQTFTHLQIRMLARTDRAGSSLDGVRIQFNSDTATGNYRTHYLYGDGSSTPVSSTDTGVAHILTFRISGATAGTGTFGTIIADILDYKSTNKNKTVRSLGGMDNNGSGEIYFGSGLYFPSTITAISNIKLTPNVGTNFVANSHFALYGIRG